MSTKAKHTPVPYYYGDMPGYGSNCIMRRPASDYGPTGTVGDAPIAVLVVRAPHWESMYPVQENGEFIVLACNAHEDVVKALEMVDDYIRHVCDDMPPRVIFHVRAALAKARGEG